MLKRKFSDIDLGGTRVKKAKYVPKLAAIPEDKEVVDMTDLVLVDIALARKFVMKIVQYITKNRKMNADTLRAAIANMARHDIFSVEITGNEDTPNFRLLCDLIFGCVNECLALYESGDGGVPPARRRQITAFFQFIARVTKPQ